MNRDKINVCKAVQEACHLLNGNAALARAVDVSPVFISYLLQGTRDVSVELAIKIEKATHGKVRMERLCPQHRALIDYMGRRTQLLATA